MSRYFTVTEELHQYLIAHGTPLDQLQQDLMAETVEATGNAAGMQISPEHAAFLTLLARLTNARHAVEVGTFTGMSSIAIARGMVDGGKLICFDISADYTAIAQKYWTRGGLTDRIELRLGPAQDGLATLPEEPHLDLAFIDADKQGYRTYWEALVPRMRPGGVIMVDNTLWSGRVLSPEPGDSSTEAIVAFNAAAAADERVDVVMLPVGDGITLAYKN